ncbi:serine/threonine-protein kinase [Miltoncostaea marina]|uniref:serine/threonine-protein kinase n=1 Tax=Miltoncostaea marina TaxID=2843215 RepID=UPI001C3C8176|nr:serine/threonine-protein kinase [Miltoncostaea marina]
MPPRLRRGAPRRVTLGSALVGRYELRELLGDGAMGSVYRAFDRELHREVAVKSLLPELAGDPVFVERFEREARALARLRHPNIIGLYDMVRPPDGGLFLILELVRGRSLQAVLDREAPLPWARCARIGIEVCSALAAAHDAGVVHRDIKPANVLMEEDGTARVADFGIAHLAGAAGTTRAGLMLGTPEYISPEQAEGRPATGRADLYSLCVVLFEASTGRLPYTSDEGVRAIAMQHIAAPVPDSLRLAPALPAEAAAIIERGMRKDPADRFADAAELAAALSATRDLPPRRPPRRTAAPTVIAPAEGPEEPAEPEPVADPEPVAERDPVADPRAVSEPAAVAGPPAPPPRREPAPPPLVWDGPPATVMAPAGDDPAGRPQRRRRVAALLAAAVIVAAAAAGGFLAGGSGGGDPPPAPGARAVEADRVSTELPGDWAPAAAGIPGVALAGGAAYAPPDGSGVIAVGRSGGRGATLLPPALLRRLPAQPRGEAVDLGGIRALRHRGLDADGVAGELTVYAVPTDDGVATLACHASPADAGAVAAACDAAAAALDPGDGHVYALDPAPSYARAVGEAMRLLRRARAGGLANLRGARLPGPQAAAADGVARAHAAAARALRAVDPGPSREAAHRRLVDAVAGGGDAFTRLAAAARAERGAGFDGARREVARADARLQAALRALAALGYDIR